MPHSRVSHLLLAFSGSSLFRRSYICDVAIPTKTRWRHTAVLCSNTSTGHRHDLPCTFCHCHHSPCTVSVYVCAYVCTYSDYASARSLFFDCCFQTVSCLLSVNRSPSFLHTHLVVRKRKKNNLNEKSPEEAHLCPCRQLSLWP